MVCISPTATPLLKSINVSRNICLHLKGQHFITISVPNLHRIICMEKTVIYLSLEIRRIKNITLRFLFDGQDALSSSSGQETLYALSPLFDAILNFAHEIEWSEVNRATRFLWCLKSIHLLFSFDLQSLGLSLLRTYY